MSTKMGRGSTHYRVVLYIATPVLLVLVWVGSYMLTDEVKAESAAEDIGYTNVEVVNKGPVLPFSTCSKGDTAEFTVAGIAPSGEKRTITVCAGIFKGGTVRSG